MNWNTVSNGGSTHYQASTSEIFQLYVYAHRKNVWKWVLGFSDGAELASGKAKDINIAKVRAELVYEALRCVALVDVREPTPEEIEYGLSLVPLTERLLSG